MEGQGYRVGDLACEPEILVDVCEVFPDGSGGRHAVEPAVDLRGPEFPGIFPETPGSGPAGLRIDKADPGCVLP